MTNYLELITNLFKDIKEVETFISIPCTKQDLECFLKECEKEELYEYCSLIKKRLENL